MSQRGIGAAQLVISMVLLGLFVAGLLFYVGFDRLFIPSSDRSPAGFYAQYIYARNRFEGMSAKLLLFQQSYGRLPGDTDADGMVASASGEMDRVAQDLFAAKAIPNPEMQFMGRHMDFFWVDDEVFPGKAPGHYFVVRSMEPELARQLDERMDDGDKEGGRIKRRETPDGGVDFYYRFTG